MKVIHTFLRVPPEALQQTLITELSIFHAVQHPRFIGKELVADRIPEAGSRSREVMDALVEGYIRGYRRALPACKPYTIKYTRRYLKKIHGVIQEVSHEVVEELSCWDDAQKREDELRADPGVDIFTLHTKYEEEKSYHF